MRADRTVKGKLLSVQFFLSLLYPGLHVQLKDPWALLQMALRTAPVSVCFTLVDV